MLAIAPGSNIVTGPATDIEVMSLAAQLLGKNPFTTVDQGGEFALAVQSLYNALVPSELANNNWRFNTFIWSLNLINNFDPQFAQWHYAYQLPPDYLALVQIFPPVQFQIFQNYIFTGFGGQLKIEYRSQVPVSYWPKYFSLYMAVQLAWYLAPSVAVNANLEKLLGQRLIETRSKAMFSDAQSHPNIGIVSKDWIQARG